MLKPASAYADQIQQKFKERFYTEDMFFETGNMSQWYPSLDEIPNEGTFWWAIVNKKDEVIGYLDYRIDYYASVACNFGLISFDKGNPIIGKDLYEKLEELVSTLHRVEWRMVGGNPVERHYDAFIKKHNGNKHVLKDAIKDKNGNYHDDVIYEIINDSIKG